MPVTFCELAGQCGGCDLITETESAQTEIKQAHLNKVVESLQADVKPLFRSVGLWQMRDRVDLTFHSDPTPKIGLFAREEKSLVHLPACPMMSSPLEAWYAQFRRTMPPLKQARGTIRLRVSPRGDRGVWLDFSHEHTKELFDEKTWLIQLLENAYVEVGQKRKKLELQNGELKLNKIHSFPWFETYLTTGPLPLSCHIASFTQPSFHANEILVRAVTELVRESQLENWIELGAGIGNFTFPIAELSKSVMALENDTWAIHHLRENLSRFSQKQKVKVHAFDFQNSLTQQDFFSTEKTGLFFDPPRSGLGKFVTRLKEFKSLPAALVYVSCYPESFIKDSQALKELYGYKVVSLTGVDQFPQSRHLELVARLERA